MVKAMKLEIGACFVAPTNVELEYQSVLARCFIYIKDGEVVCVSAYRTIAIADANVLELLMPGDILRDDILRVVVINTISVVTEIVGHRTYDERRQGYGSSSGLRWTSIVDLPGKCDREWSKPLPRQGFAIVKARSL